MEMEDMMRLNGYCGDTVEILWRQCGDTVEILWR